MRLVENSIFGTFGHIIYRSFLKTTYFIPVIDENDIFFGGRGFFQQTLKEGTYCSEKRSVQALEHRAEG